MHNKNLCGILGSYGTNFFWWLKFFHWQYKWHSFFSVSIITKPLVWVMSSPFIDLFSLYRFDIIIAIPSSKCPLKKGYIHNPITILETNGNLESWICYIYFIFAFAFINIFECSLFSHLSLYLIYLFFINLSFGTINKMHH